MGSFAWLKNLAAEEQLSCEENSEETSGLLRLAPLSVVASPLVVATCCHIQRGGKGENKKCEAQLEGEGGEPLPSPPITLYVSHFPSPSCFSFSSHPPSGMPAMQASCSFATCANNNYTASYADYVERTFMYIDESNIAKKVYILPDCHAI